jgi:carboxyl-terminal processing protease
MPRPFSRKLTIAIVSIALLLAAFSPPADRYFDFVRSLETYSTLFREVNRVYVDDLNPNDLSRTGIDAMLNSLDPYTNYIPDNEVEDYRRMNTGEYGGIGAITQNYGKRMVVTMVFDKFTANQKGLKIGDEVLQIDGIDLSKRTTEQANQLMRGQVGSEVSVTVSRFGAPKPITLTFKREKIKISNVPYYGMMTDKIGYVQLTEFTGEAAKEVGTAVVNLRKSGAASIILDLRGNPGGLLNEAVGICNLFLPKDSLVVTTRGKIPDNNRIYRTEFGPIDTELPVAVLINRGSASASEIVAGTLQDYDRAVIVGERSYGKGLVQTESLLPHKGLVKITVAKYYTPTGRCIQVLDYSHRRSDGSVASVPDSVKRAFKTTHGRTVYDGGGIEPDVAQSAEVVAPVTQSLISQGYLFDYATDYAFHHATIAEARNFSLSDNEYSEFVAWMKNKELTYQTELERKLSAITRAAKKEQLYEQLKPSIQQLEQRLANNRKNDLNLHKDQIKRLLEEQIASRYYLERGPVEVSLKYDEEIRKAIAVLNNPAQYKKILNH